MAGPASRGTAGTGGGGGGGVESKHRPDRRGAGEVEVCSGVMSQVGPEARSKSRSCVKFGI